ncbi:putative disease resistance protein RGA3, partial [Olea europaea var. sylvestris]|uniref:putative disease resistance protein RGA3 n=1 Tax=Olea europaea var. sylvestris TaxID=158386 RepID=UPI000C1CF892
PAQSPISVSGSNNNSFKILGIENSLKTRIRFCKKQKIFARYKVGMQLGHRKSPYEDKTCHFIERTGEIDSKEFKRIESTSLVDSANVHGHRIDKDNLIQNLLSEGSSGVQIVSILGKGEVCKTTLAQLAFNDLEVKEHFELRTRICFSDLFDEIKIAKLVLEAVGESSSNTSKLGMLLRVKNSVSKRKFLIILDNVWTEDHKKWKPLKNSLHGVPGSRILATTRSDRVVRLICTDTRQPLGQLLDEDCWSLLSRIAFVGRNKECKKLEDISKKIALNCNGLPLAAKTIGSLLCLKDTVGEWLNALESPLWQLEEATVELFPTSI